MSVEFRLSEQNHSLATQPKILYGLSFVEMCERLSHYTMRGILVLYMTKVLLFSHDRCFGIFAGFSALLYFSPFIGGLVADKILGFKRAIIAGGILLAIGYLLLALPGTSFFYGGLAFIAIGSGFFIPNISGLVGQLYEGNDPRREGGFSIFYAGVNLGALIPPLIIAAIIIQFGWHAGFILAGIMVLFSTIFFYFGLNHFPNLGKAPPLINAKISTYLLIVLGVLLLIPLFSELIKLPALANKVVYAFGAIFLLYAFKKSFKFSQSQRNVLHVCFFLTICSIVFEVLLQQTAMSMVIFVDENVNHHFIFWQVPTVMFQALNPLFIILLAPFVSKLWLWLDKRKLNPSIPVKFAYGTLLMGIGFIVLPYAILSSVTGRICFHWVILSYLLQSLGELLVTPVGMSMISELSPRSMVGLMMGIWYFATAVASSLGGLFSQWTVVPSTIHDSIISSFAYAKTYGILGGIAIITGLLILTLVPMLNKILSAKNYEKVISVPASSNLNLTSS